MERASFINAWDIDRQIGAATMYYAEHFGLAAGIFGQRAGGVADQALFPGFTGDEDLTFAGRGTRAPINRELNGVTQVLLFGASVRNRQSGDDQQFFTYGPNARGTDLHLANAPIDTGAMAMKTPSGNSRLRPFGDHSQFKANMGISTSICLAVPSSVQMRHSDPQASCQHNQPICWPA